METGRTYHVWYKEADGSQVKITERASRAGLAYGHPDSQRTVTIHYPEGTRPESGRVKSTLHPDGRMETYTYDKGGFAAVPATGAITFTPGAGGYLRSTTTSATVEHPGGIPGKTTRSITYEDRFTRTVATEEYLLTATGFVRTNWTINTLDEDGRVVATRSADGSVTETIWGCCGKAAETDAAGITTTYTYDALRRMTSSTRAGITTTYTYDAAGRTTSETLSAGGLSRTVSTRAYDAAGRLLSATDEAGMTTGYVSEEGGRVATVLKPGGSAETTEKHLDGRTGSVTGAGTVSRAYEYGVLPDGSRWTKVFTGPDGAASPRWEKTFTDFLGRAVRVEKPGPEGLEVTENFYDAKGRLVKTRATGRADTLYEYNELGEQTASGLDIDGSGTLERGSRDRVTETENEVKNLAGSLWRETRQYVYASENSAARTLTGATRQRLNGCHRQCNNVPKMAMKSVPPPNLIPGNYLLW